MESFPFRLRVRHVDAELSVRSFRGSESLSDIYRFDLVALAPDEGDGADLLGQTAVLMIETGGRERSITGLIDRVRRGQRLGRGHATLELRLVPHLARLRLRRASRVFQDMSTWAVVSAVCAEHAVPIRQDLVTRLPSRDLCVQHEETDYDFVCRLLAEEGIGFYFETSARAEALEPETVVLVDEPGRYPDLIGGAELLYRPLADGEESTLRREENYVARFTEMSQLAPDAFLTREFDFKNPKRSPEAGVPTERALDEGRWLKLETVYEHHGPYGENQVEPARPNMALDQIRRDALAAEGESGCGRLAPGYGVRLRDHDDSTLSGDYAITSLEHRGSTEGQLHYENSFRAVRRTFLLRPTRPVRRVRQSLETATVTGPPGEDIHTDELGRIKVQFHWDLLGQHNDQSSCWLRVAQGWAGSNWGAQFIPRVGMEVLVAFLGGDPDRPVVIGCMPNATHPPAFPLPENKTRSGWRSRSTPDNPNAGHNEISFEDAAGGEQINVVAQKDMAFTVKNDMRTSVSGTSVLEVASDHSVNVLGGHRLDVTGPSSASYGAGGFVRVRGGLNEHVSGDRHSSVGQNMEETIEGSLLRTVAGQQEVTVKGPWTSHAESLYTLIVGDYDCVGHAEVQVRGSSSHATDTDAAISAGERLTLACGGSRIEITPEGISIVAPRIELKGREIDVVGDGPALRLRDTAEMVADRINLYGKESSFELDKDAIIKGTKVYLNCGPPPPPAEDEAGEPATKKFSVKLSDEYFQPYAAKHYELRAMDFKVDGVTGSDGLIEHDIPKAARVAHISLWPASFPTGRKKAYTVKIDLLPPLATLPGLRQRLVNLGYFKGRTDAEEMDPATIAALREFQLDHDLEVTGKPDGPTLAIVDKRFKGEA